MRLNLSGVWIPFNSQAFDESLRNLDPVLLRVSNFMCIEVSNSTIEFSLRYNSFDFFDLKLNTIGKVGDLFAHSRGCCTLSMSAAHHRDTGILLG